MRVLRLIPIPIFLLLQMMVSSVLGFFFNRNDFWPGIDALAPIQNMGTSGGQVNSDLFITSSLRISGRTPYNLTLKFVDSLLPFGSEFALSVLSSLTIMLSVSLIFLALILTLMKNTETGKYMIPSVFFPAYLVYLFGCIFIPKLPYGSSIFMADYGPTVSPWSTPEFFSMVLSGSGVIALKFANRHGSRLYNIFVVFLLFSSVLIHPASSFFFLLIIVVTGICLNTINQRQLFIVNSAAISAFTILSFIFMGESTALSSLEFVEIYSKLRHPHHFVPSEYLNLGNIVIYLFAFILSLMLCRRSNVHRGALISIFIAFILSNFLQFFFVEVIPFRLIAAFGFSRINTYVLIACYVIVIHYLVSNSNISQFSEKEEVNSTWVTRYTMIIPLTMIFCCFTTNFVYQDYREFRSDTIQEAKSLKLYSGDLILVDSNVVTEGLREFDGVSIWFDYYFMFELKGIAIYRQRWLESCGTVPMTRCADSLINGSLEELQNVMQQNGINKIVTSKPLNKSIMQGKFSFLGNSKNKWSYELDTSY